MATRRINQFHTWNICITVTYVYNIPKWDSDTDIPCMKLVNSSGGHSIGVYNPDTKDKSKVMKMIKDNRIRHYAPADYSENGELDRVIKAIIDKTASYEVLESHYYENLAEAKSTSNI